MLVSSHHRFLRTSVVVLLQALTLLFLTTVKCQDVPPRIFFNCSEQLLLVSEEETFSRFALFNLISKNVTATDEFIRPSIEKREAAIDDESGILYVRVRAKGDDFFGRYDATNSDLPDADPFRVDPDPYIGIRGFDFVDGDMFFVEGDDPFTVVQAEVIDSTDPATLDVQNDNVATVDVLRALAWDSCNSMLYATSNENLVTIDIDTAVIGPRVRLTVPTLGSVSFNDITVGPSPDCVLYGVISAVDDGSDDGIFQRWVATIDPATGDVMPVANTTTDDFDNAYGIASCSNRPPIKPPGKCFVDPDYPSKMYDSKSFLEGRYYEVGDICKYPVYAGEYGHHGDLPFGITVCCQTDEEETSPDCVPCDNCSVNQEVNDGCCALAWWENGNDHHNLRRLEGTYYGGCKTKYTNGHICCKCDDGYTCAEEGGDCAMACSEKERL